MNHLLITIQNALGKKMLFVLFLLMQILPLQLAFADVEGYRGIKLPYLSGTSEIVTNDGDGHEGTNRHAIDFGMSYEIVLAIHDGQVNRTGYQSEGGNYIALDHGDGFCSIYYHLSTVEISQGEQVIQGQRIAKSGKTGSMATGPHLHLAVTKKVGDDCQHSGSYKDVPMIFDEKPQGEFQKDDTVISQNDGSLNLPVSSALTGGDFDGDSYMDLAIGVPGETVEGKVGAGAVNIIYGSQNGLAAAGDQLWKQDTDGLMGTSEWGDHFGATLASGDFDGDGFADLAIGAPGETLDGNANAGAVNILYGSAGGITTQRNQLLKQGVDNLPGLSEKGDTFGAALATADFNHDGFADLAIGIPGENVGTVSNAGAVTILYGSANGLSTSNTQRWKQGSDGLSGGAEVGDRFGAVLTTGDFDGNGYQDLAIGAPTESVGSAQKAGAVSVVYGSANGLSSKGNQMWKQGVDGVMGGAEAGDLFGAALASGDFNRDGYSDLAIGAPNESVGDIEKAGAVNVLYGSSKGVSGANDQLWKQGVDGLGGESEAGDQFGAALLVGDFDGDHFADLAIGAPSETVGSIFKAGAITIMRGSSSGLTSSGDKRWKQGSDGIADTEEAGDRFGATLAGGDFNHDGRDDLAVGVPGENIGSIRDAGAVNVLYGSSRGIAAGNNQFWHQDSPNIMGTAETGDGFGGVFMD